MVHLVRTSFRVATIAFLLTIGILSAASCGLIINTGPESASEVPWLNSDAELSEPQLSPTSTAQDPSDNEQSPAATNDEALSAPPPECQNADLSYLDGLSDSWCVARLRGDPCASSGSYTLLSGDMELDGYCEMRLAGGGWTLALVTDGLNQAPNSDKGFGFYHALFQNPNYPVASDMPTPESLLGKTEAYDHLVFQEALMVMTDASGQRRHLHLPLAQPNDLTLATVMADQVFLRTAAGLEAWRGILEGSAIQPHMQREGFNPSLRYLDGYNSIPLRLGIIGNNETDQQSHDSWIGLGGGDWFNVGCVTAAGELTDIAVVHGNGAICNSSADGLDGNRSLGARIELYLR